ncbi:hypothetical protein EW145_g3061 [Phellinidium pouzarii]|uniref:HMG box domain-containing protein n=1 Tax=Phellinidium pouzarii TaxID=167371 RepID=A0A4S4L8X1_9AGAM|nr:hypothetical protein EW145_g3061 [Phellinidium pouzarii]
MFHASTRFFLRRIVALPKLSSSHAPLPSVTRNFHLSRVVLAASGVAHESDETKTTAEETSLDKESKTKIVKPIIMTKSTAKRREVKKKDVKPKEIKKKVAKPPKAKKQARPKPKVVLKPEDKPPRKPGGPYFFFTGKISAGKKVPGPEAFLEAVKENKLAWISLSDDERQNFYNEYNAAVADYAKKRDEYLKTVDPSILKEVNRRRKMKGKDMLRKPKPRKALNAYIQYAIEMRKSTPPSPDRQGQLDFGRACGENWRAMSDAEKQPYVDRYIQAKKEYDSARLQA